MSIPISVKIYERLGVRTYGLIVADRACRFVRAETATPSGGVRGRSRPIFRLWLILTMAARFVASAQDTNTSSTNANAIAPAATESGLRPVETASTSPSGATGFDESAFRIIAERNIFNANRSGGQVRISSSRRPTRVESFTLVGTMAYEKGAFAFFDGSSSEFSKVVRSGGVIAGYKIADVLANGVKLEGDGKTFELPVGSAMRREDAGTWHLGEGLAGTASSYASTRSPTSRSSRGDSSNHSSRSSRPESTSTTDPSEIFNQEKQDRKEYKKELKLDSKAESEILKRLMERREKESQ